MGRASKLGEFVKTGTETAQIELELFKEFQGNVEKRWKIERRFGRDGKSLWKLDGENTNLRAIEKLASSLNIQTDNLCQFLPQDKVHEFSKMNAKELLTKTVEAVGEPQLKADQEQYA